MDCLRNLCKPMDPSWRVLTLFHSQMLPSCKDSPWKTEQWKTRWVLPAQTFAIVWAPPMPSGPAFEDHVSVHHLTSLLSGLCSRRRGICSLGPQDTLQEPVHSRAPEAHAPLCQAHYLWGIQRKPTPFWALTWPHPLSTQSVRNQGPRSLVKGVPRGHSFSSKAAQQLWGEEWSPRIMVTSSKFPPSLNNLLAIPTLL